MYTKAGNQLIQEDMPILEMCCNLHCSHNFLNEKVSRLLYWVELRDYLFLQAQFRIDIQ